MWRSPVFLSVREAGLRDDINQVAAYADQLVSVRSGLVHVLV